MGNTRTLLSITSFRGAWNDLDAESLKPRYQTIFLSPVISRLSLCRAKTRVGSSDDALCLTVLSPVLPRPTRTRYDVLIVRASQSAILLVVLLSAFTFQLDAQQTENNLAEVRTKAEAGDASAQCDLGIGYSTGQGVARDPVEAVKWYRKAAEQNYAQAQCNLGLCYAYGQGVAHDPVEAVKWYRKAAEQNYAQAQCNLGASYSTGQGVAQDPVEAVKWYRKAAEQNHAQAQSNLGICYAYGQGVTMNHAQAVKWVRKAAEQNFAQAQYNLGVFYASGQGVKKDQTEAVKWYRNAAEQNYTSAQSNLGLCYASGEGVKKNRTEAVKWYRKAADQNDAVAQYNLGICYENGEGVKKDQAEAVKWYRNAADQNLAQAQSTLGVFYAAGQGVVKDEVVAYMWYLLAAGQGDAPAKRGMAILENKMTRQQIAEGQALARNFTPRQLPVSGNNNAIASADVAQSLPKASGTGFFITEDGYLITNQHVAGDGVQVRLVTATGIISAKVVKVDGANDLALLKADGKFAALPVASSRPVKLGGTVATIGFPNISLQGFSPKFTRGEIGSLSGPEDDARYFQISVPVQPGNSGGALVNDRGNVVGVVCAKLSAQAALSLSGALPENVNYAIKSSFLLGFLESVPEVAAKLKEPNARDMKPEEIAEEAKEAAVLVLVY